MKLFFLLFFNSQLFSWHYSVNTLFLIQKENMGLILGVENKNKNEFLLEGGFQISLDNIKIQTLINNKKTLKANIAIKTKSEYFHILVGIQRTYEKQIKFSIGFQINYVSENFGIIGGCCFSEAIKKTASNSSTQYRYSDEYDNESNCESEDEKSNEENCEKNDYEDVINFNNDNNQQYEAKNLNVTGINADSINNVITKDSEKLYNNKENIVQPSTKNESLLTDDDDNDIKETKETEKILFYNLFHFFYYEILDFIEQKLKEKTKLEVQTELKELFGKWMKKIPSLTKKRPIDDIELKDMSSPIVLREDQIEELKSFMKNDGYNINHEQYANRIKNLKIARKIDGIHVNITHLNCDYNFKKNFDKYFSYPTIGSAEEISENRDLKKLIEIQSYDEYAKKNSKFSPYETTEEKVKARVKTDRYFNNNIILKEVLLQFVPKLIYVYSNLDHAVLVIEDKTNFTKYDPNKITIPGFCKDLVIQSGSNCCLYSLFFSILTKLMDDPQKAIKACIQMNENYNFDENRENISNLVLNIFNANKSEEAYEKALKQCKELIKTFNNCKLTKSSIFGDLLRRGVVQAKIVQFITFKETIASFKKIIKSESNILKAIIFVLEKKDLQKIIDNNWNLVEEDLLYIFKKCREILNISDKATEEECRILYEEIFEEDFNKQNKIIKHQNLADHIILFFNKMDQIKDSLNYSIINNVNKIKQKLAFFKKIKTETNFYFTLMLKQKIIIMQMIPNKPPLDMSINIKTKIEIDALLLREILVKILKIILTINESIKNLKMSIEIAINIISQEKSDLIKKIILNKEFKDQLSIEENITEIVLTNSKVEMLKSLN